MTKLLRYVSLMSAAFVVAWFAGSLGRSRIDRGARISTGEQPLPLGSQLPSAQVYHGDGAMTPVSALIAPQGATAVIIFGTACSTCIGEAIKWQELAEAAKSRLTFVGIVNSPDRAFPESMAQSASLTFPILRGHKDFPDDMRATGFPTIYVVDSTQRVLFASAGNVATDKLRNWAYTKLGLPTESR